MPLDRSTQARQFRAQHPYTCPLAAGPPHLEVYGSRWAPRSPNPSEGAFERSLVGSTPIHLRLLPTGAAATPLGYHFGVMSNGLVSALRNWSVAVALVSGAIAPGTAYAQT